MEIIQKIISLIPLIFTLLFVLVLVLGFLGGIIKGFRKSKIKLLHILIATVLTLIVYFILCNSEKVDALLFHVVDSLSGGLQDRMGVTITSYTLKGALIELIPAFVTDVGLSTALVENSAYLLTLVSFVYHLIFGIVALVLYYVLRFILYLLYLFFYSERKYKKKLKKKAEQEKKPFEYKKRRLLGGVTMVCVSLLTAIFGFSILGNLLFAFLGTGEDQMPEVTVSNEQFNDVYSIYDGVQAYGDSGIFKLFNSAKSKSGVPLYLYISGFVFSGNYDNTFTGESENVYFTHELGKYMTSFKQVAGLVLEEEEYAEKIVSGQFTQEDISKLLKKQTFRDDLRNVIGDIANDSSFMINFMFSMIDSYAKNIDSSGIVPADSPVSDIMNILFVEGYTSSKIPSEDTYVGSEPLACIKPSYLINQKDLLVVYDLFCELVDMDVLSTQEGTQLDTEKVVNAVLPHLDKLTLLSSSNPHRKDINKVFNRLYSYVECTMLQVEGHDVVQSFDASQDIDWVKEITNLVNVAADGLNIYNHINDTGLDNVDVGAILSLFDNQDFVESYDNLIKYVSENKIISVALTSPIVTYLAESTIGGYTNGYKLPEEISFVNKYNDKGELVAYGEIYNLLNFVKDFSANQEIRDFATNVNFDTNDYVSDIFLIKDQLFVKNSKGQSIVDFISDSVLVRSIASAFVINMAEGENAVLVIPEQCLEHDGDGSPLDMISKNEFDNVFRLLEAVPNDMVVSYDTLFDDILNGLGNVFENQKLEDVLVDSVLLQANAGKYIIDYCESGSVPFLTIPDALLNVSAWYNNDSEQGEFVRLYSAIKDLFLDSSTIDFENLQTQVYDQFYNLNDQSSFVQGSTRLESMYNSLLIKSSFTKICLDMIDGMVLNQSTHDSIKDSDGYFTINELSALIDVCNLLDLDVENVDFSHVYDMINDIEGLITVHTDGKFAGRSDLDVLYSSMICADLFTGELDDQIQSNDLCPISKLDQYKVNGVYPKQEIFNLCDAIVCTGLEDQIFESSQSADALMDALNNINRARDGSVIKRYQIAESRLDIAYKSNIAKTIFTEFVWDNLSSYHNPINKYSICDSNGIIKKSEIKAIVRIGNMSNFDFHDDISVLENTLKQQFATFNHVITEGEYSGEFTGYTELDLIYDSVVITHYFSLTVDTEINASDVLYSHPDAYDSKGYYKKSEIKSLVDFLDGVSIEDFDFDAISVSYIIDHVFVDKVCQSKILLSSLSYDFRKISSIIMPYEAHSVYDSTNKFLTDIELFEMLDFSKTLGIDYLADVKTSFNSLILNLDLNKVPEYIDLSLVITATVSNEIFNSSDLIIPAKDVIIDEIGVKYIDREQLKDFVLSMVLLGVDDVDHAKHISVDDLLIENATDQNYQLIASSDILRAIVSKNLHFGNDVDTTVISTEIDFGSDVKDHLGNNITIIHENEFIALLKGINEYNNEHAVGSLVDVNISLTDILDTSVDTLNIMLESSTIRLAISQLLIDNSIASASLGETVTVYDLNNNNQTTAVLFSKDLILDKLDK
ncbi:MAG: hypothetical protein II988_04285 [Clostridia bacterium]|nr:hypothetical protein [Clostridia bacterium]